MLREFTWEQYWDNLKYLNTKAKAEQAEREKPQPQKRGKTKTMNYLDTIPAVRNAST